MSREAEIVITGNAQELQSLEQLFSVLLTLIRSGYILNERDIAYAVELSKSLQADELLDLYKSEITTTYRGKPIRIKTIGQRRYVSTIRRKISCLESVLREPGKHI